MYNIEAPHINGKFLYYAFIAGGKEILQNQTEINRINVFPVNDNDTGTNLASTVRSVIDNIKGRYRGLRSREGERIPQSRSQFGLQSATRLQDRKSVV